MAQNPDFFEVTPRNPDVFWKFVPEESSPWHETKQDRVIPEVREELFTTLWPIIQRAMIDELTERQWEVFDLYCKGLTQTKIGECLGINQSTVTRTLYGVKRNGKTVGGIVQKIQNLIDGPNCPDGIYQALRAYKLKRHQALVEY